uniref:Putative sugar ABC transporter sugar-binding protein n=1 Tax=uncultured bacterium 1114 TaxID=548901 RepID=B8R929_9BACT|nr:putative sugar ABC transporter sugar-binding protein [uncultured bacterium 1114]
MSPKFSVVLRRTRLVLSCAGAALIVMATSWAQAQQPVTLNWTTWSSAERQIRDKIVIERYQQLNPHIKIQYQAVPGATNYFNKMNLLLAAKDTPDIAAHFNEWLLAWHKLDVMDDLRPYLDADKDGAQIRSELLGMSMFTAPNGSIDALPWLTTSFMLFYNADLFRKNNVPLPTANWTFNDFLDAGRKLTKKNASGEVVQWGAMNFSDWDYLVRWMQVPFDGYHVSPDMKRCGYDQPGTIAGLEFYQTLYREGIVPPFAQTKGVGDRVTWQSGNVGMVLHQQAALLQLMNGATFDWQIQHIPVGPKGTRVTRGASAANGILKTSKHKKEAWDFLKFISIGEGAALIGSVGAGGANKRVLRESTPEIKSSTLIKLSAPSFNAESQAVYIDSASYADAVVYPSNNGEIEKAFAPMWDELRLVRRPAAAIAKDMQNACMKLLAELK